MHQVDAHNTWTLSKWRRCQHTQAIQIPWIFYQREKERKNRIKGGNKRDKRENERNKSKKKGERKKGREKRKKEQGTYMPSFTCSPFASQWEGVNFFLLVLFSFALLEMALGWSHALWKWVTNKRERERRMTIHYSLPQPEVRGRHLTCGEYYCHQKIHSYSC